MPGPIIFFDFIQIIKLRYIWLQTFCLGLPHHEFCLKTFIFLLVGEPTEILQSVKPQGEEGFFFSFFNCVRLAKPLGTCPSGSAGPRHSCTLISLPALHGPCFQCCFQLSPTPVGGEIYTNYDFEWTLPCFLLCNPMDNKILWNVCSYYRYLQQFCKKCCVPAQMVGK